MSKSDLIIFIWKIEMFVAAIICLFWAVLPCLIFALFLLSEERRATTKMRGNEDNIVPNNRLYFVHPQVTKEELIDIFIVFSNILHEIYFYSYSIYFENSLMEPSYIDESKRMKELIAQYKKKLDRNINVLTFVKLKLLFKMCGTLNELDFYLGDSDNPISLEDIYKQRDIHFYLLLEIPPLRQELKHWVLSHRGI